MLHPMDCAGQVNLAYTGVKVVNLVVLAAGIERLVSLFELLRDGVGLAPFDIVLERILAAWLVR